VRIERERERERAFDYKNERKNELPMSRWVLYCIFTDGLLNNIIFN